MKKRVVLLTSLAAVIAAGSFFFASISRRKPAGISETAPRSAAATVASSPTSSPPPPTLAAIPGLSSPAATNIAPAGAQPPVTHEFDLSVNPYAAALREPGKSKRAWDPEFLKQFSRAESGDPIRFELTSGRAASGLIRITRHLDGEINYLSGDLTEPEAGKFFFLTPPVAGKAGKVVGVIEFPASKTAYRIEPTGPNGDPELWQRRLDEVLCQDLPRATGAASATTNETAEMPPLRPDLVPDYAPAYNSNIVSLQSYPGSPAVLLLDFFGGYTSTWGGIAYARPAGVNNVTIRDLWKRVAEDFMPFNINVTTDIKVYLAAPMTSRQRCCFTDTPVTAAGVAYMGSWNWGSDTPCWSVYTTGKNGAEVGAHEPGHTLGLGHMGNITGGATNEYYSGQGNGAAGWAPIMGVGYYKNVSSWAKGEYSGANNTQDELKVIISANNSVAYRPDDTGGTLATSRHLEIDEQGNAWAEGVIERTGDTDAFQFTTSGGMVTLSANPAHDWANLALMVALTDAQGGVYASNNPASTLSAGIATNLPAGTYTFAVSGAGRNDPSTTGFSSYASLGYYSIAGSIDGARAPTRLSIMEHSPNGAVAGTVPGRSGGNLAYSIESGNTGTVFAIDNNGVITVADSAPLDYNLRAADTMLPVQYQLFVNITNLDNPSLTELNRRVVIAVLRRGANYPIAVTGYNAGILAPCTATPAVPQATALDLPNQFAFYQAGLNANPRVGGTGGEQGLPASGTVLSALDNSIFQLGPYGGFNALVLGYSYPRSGTLLLQSPRAYNSLAILATSANGGGNGTLVIHFLGGAKSEAFSFNAQDWYNTKTNVALQGFGRLKLGQATLPTEDPGWNNPNLYQTTIDLARRGLNQPIESVTFTAPGIAGTTATAVLALSGEVMPAAINIAQQPQAITNTVPGIGATFKVVAMGTPPLEYQWFYSASGRPDSFAPLEGETAPALTLPPFLDVTNAGAFYVVITNSAGAVTSTVATLTVFRAPAITQPLAPADLRLLAGRTAVFSLAANGVTPTSYYWFTNGVFRSGSAIPSLSISNVREQDAANYSVVVTNAFGAVTSGIVSLAVIPVTYPAAQNVLDDRPLAYWRLDETTGTIAHDYVSGKNGVYNKVQLGQPGYNLLDTHLAARFGYLANNTSLVTNIPIDFATSGNAAFSIEAWVKGGPQASDSGLVTKGYGSGGEQFNLDCGGPGRAFRFFVRDSTGSARVAAGSITPNNQWHHLVGVCDQARSNVLLYVDGVLAATASIIPGSGLLSANNPVTIGCRRSSAASGYDLQFNGIIQDVAIYDYALSAARAQAHFASAANRPPVFVANPFAAMPAEAGRLYTASIATHATDPNGDLIMFSKLAGPGWLNVAGNGALSGTPSSSDAGANLFTVRASDPGGLFTTATLTIHVSSPTPIGALLLSESGRIRLSWSGGLPPYEVWMTTNLDLPWEKIADSLADTNYLIFPSNPAAFYRVLGR